MSDRPPFRLFERYGVELEYMIVDARSLDVLPVTDRVLYAVAGEYLSEFELGSISWSNELALHVIELKTTDPAASLDGLAAEFQEHVGRINRILEPLGGRLMPTAMHPWMDPHREMRLWPHDFSPIYEAFHRVFDCRGHGWANLQSVHLNLPFADDEEFARLHAAIRLLLPIMPALAASSPVMDGKTTGRLDNRLDVYRQNARRVPRVSGSVIPEAVFSKRDYEQEILQPLYRDIAPLDPDGTLQYEWLNARGAIARFDRNTIEVRVLDVQECPRADLAVCRLLTGVLQAMCAERWMPLARQQAFGVEPLQAILLDAIGAAENTRISDAEYAAAFGFAPPAEGTYTAGQLWQHLYRQVRADEPFPEPLDAALHTMFESGSLATRIARGLADNQPGAMTECYRRLCDCLAEDRMFTSP
jgi:gamma-glutamyl:cysteine ligase YbdK (ATP-grasp superfamily)